MFGSTPKLPPNTANAPHTTTRCNSLQLTATLCNSLQLTAALPHTTTHGNTQACLALLQDHHQTAQMQKAKDLRRAELWTLHESRVHSEIADIHQTARAQVDTATHCNTLQRTATHSNTLQHTATYCNTLQHTVTRCNTLQHTATYCNTLQHTATYCNTLQHTATHCNIL